MNVAWGQSWGASWVDGSWGAAQQSAQPLDAGAPFRVSRTLRRAATVDGLAVLEEYDAIASGTVRVLRKLAAAIAHLAAEEFAGAGEARRIAMMKRTAVVDGGERLERERALVLAKTADPELEAIAMREAA